MLQCTEVGLKTLEAAVLLTVMPTHTAGGTAPVQGVPSARHFADRLRALTSQAASTGDWTRLLESLMILDAPPGYECMQPWQEQVGADCSSRHATAAVTQIVSKC